jgi:hypothetical protein
VLPETLGSHWPVDWAKCVANCDWDVVAVLLAEKIQVAASYLNEMQ